MLKIREAVERELKKKPTGWAHAMFLKFLKSDYEAGDFDTNRVDVVREKYGL